MKGGNSRGVIGAAMGVSAGLAVSKATGIPDPKIAGALFRGIRALQMSTAFTGLAFLGLFQLGLQQEPARQVSVLLF